MQCDAQCQRMSSSPTTMDALRCYQSYLFVYIN